MTIVAVLADEGGEWEVGANTGFSVNPFLFGSYYQCWAESATIRHIRRGIYRSTLLVIGEVDW
jgi:hypothetical protein